MAELCCQFVDGRRVVGGDIRDPHAAAEVDDRNLLGLLDAELGDDVAEQTDHAVRCHLETVDVEDLRTDVAVQADQAQVVGSEDATDRVDRRSPGQRETELLVLVCGGDEFVSMRFDADGQSDQHVLNDTGLTGDTIESVDLDRRVEHDVSDARGDTSGQFGD